MEPGAMSFTSALRGSSLTARIFRSAGLTVAGFGASQAIRLASNLILTRILFPEAFGMMAIIVVILMGLAMFSDVGVTPAIMQSKRGDDRDFLDTAWTIQVIRGVALWVVACGLAWPAAWFYGEPDLVYLLPVASLVLIINGCDPTKKDTANRHLVLGRVTTIEIVVQLVGIVTAVALALWWNSVWALVVSYLMAAAAQLVLFRRFLPGPNNRFRWEKPAAHELINFGKWVFLSTLCGFFFAQGDRIVLGKVLELDTFGVYNIAYFLASFPLLLGGMITRKILIPIYRETPPKASRANFLKLRKMRVVVTAALLLMQAVFACLGVWLVDLLYDPRYALAGPVVVVIAVMQIPMLIALTYDQAALAAGDSRRFFVLAVARAVLMIAGLVVGYQVAGLFGALLGQGVAMVAVYPVVIWLARHMGAWDVLHDAVFAVLGIAIGLLALWLNAHAVAELAAF
ncbi:polysaccharide biosynthesis protein [Pseudaestuariivita atlantica]|uniref:Polysaccharide biosynthesis protein n=2 Tax=Pseudaestuariivita atlantica TaxID=1317121 RepID=A0A0L1JP95_9RHOB|nr:polysaccharide biosynthesis protein [Pseudaestuariivita atlantica]